jgi:predicted TIM-barrel enzyme
VNTNKGEVSGMSNLRKPLIVGAVHLPYYGRNNPKQSIWELEDYALQNVGVFFENGIDTVYIQDENLNLGAAYPETISVLSAIGKSLKIEYPELKLGFIVQAHDGVAPIAAATACGADFVRIKVFVGSMQKAEGIREGVGIEAVNYRTSIGSDVKILADIFDREGIPIPGIPLDMALGWADRAGADCFVLTVAHGMRSLHILGCAKLSLDKQLSWVAQ